jgi:GxxExxY protein
MPKYKHEELTKEIINAAYTVHNTLGYGFLEKIYHSALIIELESRKIPVESQKKLIVRYRRKIIGEFMPDIIVDSSVIVEVKSTENHNPAFEAQLLNYLKASDFEVGLLVNFGRSVKVKRMVL